MVVRNLKHSLLKVEPACSDGMAVNQSSSTPHRRTKVGVLISGTGVCPVFPD